MGNLVPLIIFLTNVIFQNNDDYEERHTPNNYVTKWILN